MSTEPQEKDIYFVRHGLSEANGKQIFHGGDVPLTEIGKQQAKFVAERLRDVGAEVIITSPMPRAHQTAEAIQQSTDLPLEETNLLREFVPPSSLLGKKRSCPEGREYVKTMLDHLDDPDWHHSDEENYHDMHKRSVQLLDYFTTRPENKILAVTHAGFMRVVFTAMMTEGEPNAELTRHLMRFLRPMNTGVTIAHYRPQETYVNKWRLITWNDHAHLAETDTEEPKDYSL